MRIIGGEWRSRILSFPDSPDLRPTPDRVKETLFNWLGRELHGRICLDLFAGSGALGFEALSRGAGSVVMVESHRQAYRALQANARKLGGKNLGLLCMDALKFLAYDERLYDVIFLDPPYRKGLLPALLERLPGHLADGGMVYVESGTRLENIPGWQVWRVGRAGQVNYQLLKWKPDE